MLSEIVDELKKCGVVFDPVSAFVDYRRARSFRPNEMSKVDERITAPIFEFSCSVPDDRRLTATVFFQPNPDMAQYDLLRMVGGLGCRVTVPLEDQTTWMVMPTTMKRRLLSAAALMEGKVPVVVTKNINTKVVGTTGPLIPTQKLCIHRPPQFGQFMEPDLHKPLTKGWVVGITAQG